MSQGWIIVICVSVIPVTLLVGAFFDWWDGP